MSDPFDTFSLQPRPWLDPAELQSRFHALAAKHHPDAAHANTNEPFQKDLQLNSSNGDDATTVLATDAHPDKGAELHFLEINEAHKTLKDPVTRLHHLLTKVAPSELEVQKSGSVSVDMSERFLQVATILRETAAFREQQSLSLSPVTRAVLRAEHLSLRRDLDRTLARMDELWNQCEHQIQAADAVWERRTPGILRQLATIQREMSYLQKWRVQLREARLLMSI